MAVEEERRVRDLGMPRLKGESLEPIVKQALGPEASLHWIPDKLECRQMQFASDFLQHCGLPPVNKNRFSASMARKHDDSFDNVDPVRNPKVEFYRRTLTLSAS